jgi:hypothetical protein
MLLAGFEPAILASGGKQALALGRYCPLVQWFWNLFCGRSFKIIIHIPRKPFPRGVGGWGGGGGCINIKHMCMTRLLLAHGDYFNIFQLPDKNSRGVSRYIYDFCGISKYSPIYSTIYALYSSPNIIWVIKSRRLRWAGNVVCMWAREDSYRVWVGKPEGRRPLERSRRRWEDNIKIGRRQVGWGMDWIDLAQDRNRWRAVVNAVMNLRVL